MVDTSTPQKQLYVVGEEDVMVSSWSFKMGTSKMAVEEDFCSVNFLELAYLVTLVLFGTEGILKSGDLELLEISKGTLEILQVWFKELEMLAKGVLDVIEVKMAY